MSVQTIEKNYDVVVVGGGPMGWCTAQILTQSSVRALLIEPRPMTPYPPWMDAGLGVFWPSLNDPPTRALVAHGAETSEWLQDFCDQGKNFAVSYLGQSCTESLNAFRIGVEEHEINELRIAADKKLGLVEVPHLGMGIFKETSDCGVLVSRLGQTLKPSPTTAPTKQARVIAVEESQDFCLVTLDTGERLTCEIVVLATGHELSELCPWLSPMLVPMADIKTEWNTNLAANEGQSAFALRTSNGHVAALFRTRQTQLGKWEWSISLTGPRFLLPRAGAGLGDTSSLAVHSITPKIEAWMRQKLIPSVPRVLLNKLGQCDERSPLNLILEKIETGVDCLPCDELPVLGELGTQGRVLGGTGWLGCGWSAGFQSARVIVDLILKGRSEKMHSLLKPRRWRSGLSDGVTGMT